MIKEFNKNKIKYSSLFTVMFLFMFVLYGHDSTSLVFSFFISLTVLFTILYWFSNELNLKEEKIPSKNLF